MLSEALTVGGVAAEIAGVVAIARPDATPYAEQASAALRTAAVASTRRIRRQAGLARRSLLRLLRRPGPQRVQVGRAAEVSGAGRLTAVGIKGRTSDEKIAALAVQLAKLEGDLDDRIARAIAAAEERHRPLRALGAALLVLGGALLVTGTLLA